MMLLPLSVNCPNCGSSNITYTCEPKCCFNHLCGDCYSTFELGTSWLGRKIHYLKVHHQETDSLAPTAPCALCESIDLFQLDEGQGPSGKLFCSACHAVLMLEIDNVIRGA